MRQLTRVIQILSSAGFTLVFFSVVYSYLTESVNVVFVKSIKNQYEFYLENNSPFDRVIESFRVRVPRSQKIIFKITEDIPAENTPNGIVLFGGNNMYVPAVEFHDIDGKFINSRSKEKILIPPLMSRHWLEPEAFMASITVVSKPKNYVINKMEQLLSFIRIKNPIFYQRYVIINNYWQTTESTDSSEAIKILCRNDNGLDVRRLCEK